MTAADKAEFLEKTKPTMEMEHGVSWETLEPIILKDLEDIFDDKKFLKMDPEHRGDAALARRAFDDKKPKLVDYLIWMASYVSGSEYVGF